MRTTALVTVIFAAIFSTSASAAPLPEREVRINTERFAQLPLAEQERVLVIKDRLESLMATDRSTLDPVQRKELRNEWKELKGEMKDLNSNGNVIYISTAGLIIIILLLIILL